MAPQCLAQCHAQAGMPREHAALLAPSEDREVLALGSSTTEPRDLLSLQAAKWDKARGPREPQQPAAGPCSWQPSRGSGVAAGGPVVQGAWWALGQSDSPFGLLLLEQSFFRILCTGLIHGVTAHLVNRIST